MPETLTPKPSLQCWYLIPTRGHASKCLGLPKFDASVARVMFDGSKGWAIMRQCVHIDICTLDSTVWPFSGFSISCHLAMSRRMMWPTPSCMVSEGISRRVAIDQLRVSQLACVDQKAEGKGFIMGISIPSYFSVQCHFWSRKQSC